MAFEHIRLRTILALLVLATAAPIGFFAGAVVFASWQQQRAVVDRQNVETARAIAIAIDNEVESAIAALTVLGAHQSLDDLDARRFTELALRLVPLQPGWHAVLLLDPSGRIIANTAAIGDTAAAGAAAAQAVVANGRPAISNLFDDAATGQYFVLIAMPVVRDGKVKLVLGAQLRSEALSNILHRQNPPPNGVVTLIDRAQIIMARTRSEKNFIGKPPSRGFQDAASRMSEGSWRETLLEGTPAYAALSRSLLTGWTVGLGLPAEYIDGPIQRSFLALAGVGLAMLALGVVAALVLGHIIVHALSAASLNAGALARGEAVTPTRSRVAEMAGLSRSLTEAAATLERRMHERDAAERERAQAAAERELALAAEQAAHAASAKDRARLAVTLQSIGDAVIATDPSGAITMLNPVAQALTGWIEAAAIGQPIERVFNIVNEHSRRTVENPVSKVFREGRIVGLANHTVLIARDGCEAPIEDSAAPIRAADGALLGVVLVFRDVTDRRDAERDRARLLEREQAARQEAEALSRSKDEFVATVSHELRNPLNAIFGWVRLLRSGTLDSTARARALDVIERNTRAQAQLIEDLLDMSRVVRGNMRLEMRPIALVPVLEAAIEAVRPTLEAKGLEIAFDADPSVGLIAGDPDRIQQIAWNLLTNSAKFTPKGGRIVMSLGTEGMDAVIRVSDTGIGISPELLPHIFERFRQGASSVARTHGGLGIGLALVRHLTELHGGTVTAESKGEGHGAAFTVRLPALSPHAVAVRESLGLSTALQDANGPDVLTGLHVLAVDDDPDARDLISTTLRQAGARVTPAASVHDALNMLQSAAPDVVVSDVAMPNGTGYDLLREVRAAPATNKLPVVALTAYSRLEDHERALQAGFDLHLGKPVDPAVLVRTVAAAAGRG